MEFVAKGAEGSVHRLTSPRVAGFSQPLAFKEILPTLTPEHRARVVHAMEHAVDLRAAMDPADRAELDRVTTWPLALVQDHGTTVGTLMPLIPDDFFVTTQPQTGPPGRLVFEFAFLCAADSYLKRIGVDRSAADDPLIRLALATQLSYAIALLHKHDIVYGDLSLRNVAIAVNPPRLLLLDCDPAAALTDTARHQLHSPFFGPPECKGQPVLQDLVTDVYKLGLCVLRGMVSGQGVTQLTDPAALAGTLDPEGVDLITQAISDNRDDRPTAKALYHYLERTVLSRAQPPVLHTAALDRDVLLRGRDVVVTWSVSGATQLRITGTNGLAVDITDPTGHPHGYAVQPLGSGPVVVEATNRHGTVSAVAGHVDLYDLPPFEISELRLPRTHVPALSPVQVPTVLSALPPRPLVTVDTHPVPRLTAPDIWATVQALQPKTPAPPLVPGTEGIAGTTETFQLAHRHVNERVSALITDALETALRSARQPPTGSGKAAP